jgi:hypothetical protein
MEADVKCNYKPKQTTWKAKLSGNSTTFGNKLGNKPNASCAEDLSQTSFPSQAHL